MKPVLVLYHFLFFSDEVQLFNPSAQDLCVYLGWQVVSIPWTLVLELLFEHCLLELTFMLTITDPLHAIVCQELFHGSNLFKSIVSLFNHFLVLDLMILRRRVFQKRVLLLKEGNLVGLLSDLFSK